MAPAVLLADIRETRGQKTLEGKMVAVPVSFHGRQNTVNEVTSSSDVPFVAKIVRGCLFPGTVYKAVVRPVILREAYDYLVVNQTFFHEGYDVVHGLQPGFMGRLHEKTFAPGQGFRVSARQLSSTGQTFQQGNADVFPQIVWQ